MSRGLGAVPCLLIAVLLAACGEPTHSRPPDAGLRVVSLAPHLTELVYTAGAGDALVGVVEYSDFPPAARDIPRVGDAFRVDYEALARAAPNLVLAWQGGNPAALIEDLSARGYRVEALRTGELGNIAANLRRIGALTGSERQAGRAADEFLAELADLRERHAQARPLRVFFQVARQPLYTVSDRHAIGQILSLCGGRNVFGSLPSLAPGVAVESVVAADPEVLLTTGAESELDDWQRFATMSAVAHGHVYGVTPDLIARDSVRILQGAREICAHLEDARFLRESMMDAG